MAEARFVYSPGYYCDIGEHVFRTDKYRLLYERMVSEGLARPEDFITPEPATREQLELVHTPEYVSDLLAARHTRRTERSELPIDRAIVDGFILGAGGTIAACRAAAGERTMAMNLAGGFHHAFADWAEGFCYVNDVALGVKVLLEEGLVGHAMVVDCDLHQGNGTANIFRGEQRAFTFSIHQESIYPVKERSDLDVGLPDGCSARAYCDALREHLPAAMRRFRPEFVLYVAGADPFEGDQLGSLQLTLADLRERDDIVLGACAERGVPVAAVLAGGYAADVRDTVRAHLGTALSLIEHCGRM